MLNIGPEAGEEGKKKEVKTATFPTLLTMIVVSGCFTGSCFKDFVLGFEVSRELARFRTRVFLEGQTFLTKVKRVGEVCRGITS